MRMMVTVRSGEGGNGISGREALFIFYGSGTSGRALVSVCLPSLFDGEMVGAACITHGHYTVTYSTSTVLVPWAGT